MDISPDLIKYRNEFESIQNILESTKEKSEPKNYFFFSNVNVNIVNNIYNINIIVDENSQKSKNETENNYANVLETQISKSKKNQKPKIKKFENYFIGQFAQLNYSALIKWLISEDIIKYQNESENYLWVKQQYSNIHIGVLFYLLDKFKIIDFKKHSANEKLDIFNSHFEYEQTSGSLVRQFQDHTSTDLDKDYENFLKDLKNKYFQKFENMERIFKK